MIRTIVCEKEGCSGNEFYIQSEDNRVKLICTQCKSEYVFEINYQEFLMLSNCSHCNNKTFKVFRDSNKGDIYAKCTKCGATPEKIYIDSDGIQVSYESKLLNDIKEMMTLVEQRIYNLEVNMKDLERGQEVLEQSLAYINRYLVEKD